MNKKSFLTGSVVGILITVLAAFIAYKSLLTQPDISLNSIKLEDLNGRQVNFTQLIGKPLVLNYWATWCGPCRQEFPEFEKVKQQLSDKVNFVMVSDESTQMITDYKNNNPYSFIFLRSSKELKNINVRPSTYFYSKKGKLVAKQTGGMNEKQLIEMINKIME